MAKLTSTTLENWVKIWEKIKGYVATVAAGKQDRLVSGSNIKTVNGASLLGQGDISIDLSLYVVVTALPTEGMDSRKIYLVRDASGSGENVYKEYVYVTADKRWEQLGTFQSTVDLTPMTQHIANGDIHVTKADKDRWNALKGYSAATQNADGLMSAADKRYVDAARGIADWKTLGAQAPVSGSNSIVRLGTMDFSPIKDVTNAAVEFVLTEDSGASRQVRGQAYFTANNGGGKLNYGVGLYMSHLPRGSAYNISKLIYLVDEEKKTVTLYLKTGGWIKVDAAARSRGNMPFVLDMAWLAAGEFATVDAYTTVAYPEWYASKTVAGVMKVGDYLTVDGQGNVGVDRARLGIPAAYSLPAATASSLGGVKVGSGLSVAADGALSVPAASASNAGSMSAADKAKLDSLSAVQALTDAEIEEIFK